MLYLLGRMCACSNHLVECACRYCLIEYIEVGLLFCVSCSCCARPLSPLCTLSSIATQKTKECSRLGCAHIHCNHGPHE